MSVYFIIQFKPLSVRFKSSHYTLDFNFIYQFYSSMIHLEIYPLVLLVRLLSKM